MSMFGGPVHASTTERTQYYWFGRGSEESIVMLSRSEASASLPTEIDAIDAV